MDPRMIRGKMGRREAACVVRAHAWMQALGAACRGSPSLEMPLRATDANLERIADCYA
jgi:hypothetical protein